MDDEQKDFEFTMWPAYPIDIEPFDDDFSSMWENDLSTKWYTKRPLPPGYGYFMHLGPKTKAGDWTALALRNPIALFVLGVGLLTPIIGITYCILLRKGFCGSPHSCERPFQREWRFFLNFVIFLSIFSSLPGLFSAYMGIMQLMAVSMQVERAPNLDDMIQDSITQIKHLFTVNKDESDTLTKAMVLAAISKNLDDIRESDPLQQTYAMEQFRKPFDVINGYVIYRVVTDESAHAVVNFHRDIYREWMRRFGDHLNNLTRYDEVTSRLELGDYPAKFFCPRMLFEYDDAMIEIEKLIQPYIDRLTVIDNAFNVSLNEALEIIQKFREEVIVCVNEHYAKLEEFGGVIMSNLSEIIQKSRKELPQYDATEIRIPYNVSDYALVVCVIFSIVYISYLVGLIVGLLGSRGPRDIFGFNKKTASRILTVVLITTFAVYCVCAFGSIRMFYYALVIENGVCNIEAVTPGGDGITIFHSCKLEETVFTRMIKSGVLAPFPLNTTESIILNASENMLKKWKETYERIIDTNKPILLKLEQKLIAQARVCDKMWPGKMLEDFKNDHFYYIYSTYAPKGFSNWNIVTGPEEDYYVGQYACLNEFRYKLLKMMDENALHPFVPRWFTVYSNFTRDYRNGIAESFTKQFKLDHENLKKYLGTTDFLVNVSETVNENLKRALKKYHFWLENALTNEIGACGIMSDTIRRTVKRVCDCISGPLNGTWTGLFWILIVLPVIIAATIPLINNYKKVAVDYTPTDLLYRL